MAQYFDFDPVIKHPFTSMVIGPTQCGKTYFVLRLISCSNVFDKPPERIIWCYDFFRDIFRSFLNIEFFKGLPSIDMLDGRRTLLVIGDLMKETDDSVTALFTKGSHHMNASVIYISQNVFNKGKENRNINFNTH